MSYQTRVLPVEEWDRLRDLPFATNGLPDPAFSQVIVTETTEGQIVGLWAMLTAVHLDGLWTDSAHRGTVVAGQLLATMKDQLAALGITVSFTVISDPQVMVLAHKAGFTRYPGDLWILQTPAEPPAGG